MCDITQFEIELTQLINKFNQEAYSGTADFILATYLSNCLDTFTKAVKMRDDWYGHKTYITKQKNSVGLYKNALGEIVLGDKSAVDVYFGVDPGQPGSEKSVKVYCEVKDGNIEIIGTSPNTAPEFPKDFHPIK